MPESDKNSSVVPTNTLRVMMYIFPRQFGLHNVFTSTVDKKQTAQKFQDYTLREEEIFGRYGRSDGNLRTVTASLPKRLRGDAARLVERLQVRHGRCSYFELLQHYCPVWRHKRIFSQYYLLTTIRPLLMALNAPKPNPSSRVLPPRGLVLLKEKGNVVTALLRANCTAENTLLWRSLQPQLLKYRPSVKRC
jgi:hypothetical protein